MSYHIVKISAKYLKEDAVIVKQQYGNGSTALLLNSLDGERLATATVALDVLPEEGNVFIKDYSENQGILKSLQDAGVVGDVIRSVPAGFTHVHEVKLLLEEV